MLCRQIRFLSGQCSALHMQVIQLSLQGDAFYKAIVSHWLQACQQLLTSGISLRNALTARIYLSIVMMIR